MSGPGESGPDAEWHGGEHSLHRWAQWGCPSHLIFRVHHNASGSTRGIEGPHGLEIYIQGWHQTWFELSFHSWSQWTALGAPQGPHATCRKYGARLSPCQSQLVTVLCLMGYSGLGWRLFCPGPDHLCRGPFSPCPQPCPGAACRQDGREDDPGNIITPKANKSYVGTYVDKEHRDRVIHGLLVVGVNLRHISCTGQPSFCS